MIYDAENTFLWEKDVAAVGSTGIDSDVVFAGTGDAVNPLWLVVRVDADMANDATIEIETAETEDMAAKVTLGTFTMAKDAGTLSVKLPLGCLGFLRLHVASAAGSLGSGKMNAFLALDTDIDVV